ncbi:MAG TPA: hypothetical protein VNO19_11305 [Gemmatimonadales bacterium]|nr:hypothetical protein [Gemmatimonadales bacterium]
MRRRSGILLAIVLLVSLAGCAETFDAMALGVPATLASPADQPPVGDRFKLTQRAVYGLWGIVMIKSPSLRKALAAQLAGGSSIVGVRIKVRSRWSDVLITALTAGLIVPRSVTFEGVVTK